MRNNEDMLSRELRTPTPSQTRPTSGYLELSSVTPTSTTSTTTVAGTRQPSLPRISVHNSSRLNSVGSSNGCVSPSPPHTINNNYSEFFPTESAEGATYVNVNCGNEVCKVWSLSIIPNGLWHCEAIRRPMLIRISTAPSSLKNCCRLKKTMFYQNIRKVSVFSKSIKIFFFYVPRKL